MNRTLVELAGNRHLLEMLDNIRNHAVAFHLFSAIDTGDWRTAITAVFGNINDGFDLQARVLRTKQGT